MPVLQFTLVYNLQRNYFICCRCCHNFYYWKATVFINDKKEVKLVSYWSFKICCYMLPWAIRYCTWLQWLVVFPWGCCKTWFAGLDMFLHHGIHFRKPDSLMQILFSFRGSLMTKYVPVLQCLAAKILVLLFSFLLVQAV